MTTSEQDLSVLRRAYARQIVHAAGSGDARLEQAFGSLLREDFLGPGPWAIMHAPNGFHETPDADPLYVYQDAPVSLMREKRLNNGQPSYLAMLIGLCAFREGDSAVHVGTGTGYYTAVISRLVASTGRVLGIEYEVDLAGRAARNLAGFAQTRIVEGDGFTRALEPADAILVNAGTPRIATTWLDALTPGGHLVLPLATPVQDECGGTMTRGAIVHIVRDAEGFAASVVCGTLIDPCIGAANPEAEAALAAALEAGGAGKVTRLRREKVADANCWLRGEGWSLTFD